MEDIFPDDDDDVDDDDDDDDIARQTKWKYKDSCIKTKNAVCWLHLSK